MKVVKSFSISIPVAEYLESRKRDESNFLISTFIEDLIKVEMQKTIEVKQDESV